MIELKLRRRWRKLLMIVATVIGLEVILSLIPLSQNGEFLVQLGVFVALYGLVLVWVIDNTFALYHPWDYRKDKKP